MEGAPEEDEEFQRTWRDHPEVPTLARLREFRENRRIAQGQLAAWRDEENYSIYSDDLEPE